MSDSDPPTEDAARLADLERRLNAKRDARAAADAPGRHASFGALGVAWRMSVELVVAVCVGGALGLGLDRVLHTEPWIMLVGFGFGFAAGVRAVMRAAHDLSGRSSSVQNNESN